MRLERRAQQAHHPVALRQQVAQTLLEGALLPICLARFRLSDLQDLFGAAQPRGDRRAPVLHAGEPVLVAGDLGQQLHQRRVRRVAFALALLLLLLGTAGQRLRLRHRLLLRGQGTFQRAQLVAALGGLVLLGRQLLAQLGELLATRRDRLGERLTLAPPVLDAALRVLDLVAQAEQRLAPLAEHALALGQLDALALDCELALREPRLEGRQLVEQSAVVLARALDLRAELAAVVGRQREIEHPAGLPQPLVAGRLLGLALDRVDLAPDLAEHVAHPQQVLLGRLDLRLRLPPARLVLADPRRLLDQDAALLGLGGDDLGDLPLLHDRVALGADAGVAEEVVDVAQATGRLVEQVLGLAAAVEPPRDLDLAEGGVGRGGAPVGVVDGENHLGHADAGPPLGADEDDVLHPLAAQPARGLLAHHPAHGIHHVGLAAAVGADDRRDAVGEFEPGPVDEGLEAVEIERLDPHRAPGSSRAPPATADGRTLGLHGGWGER